MTKITRSTVKSFIRKNRGNLLICCKSHFDGMVDGVMPCENPNEFSPALDDDHSPEHTLGIHGAWFVGQSRDYFSPYANDNVSGIEVYNCCGSFILAVPVQS